MLEEVKNTWEEVIKGGRDVQYKKNGRKEWKCNRRIGGRCSSSNGWDLSFYIQTKNNKKEKSSINILTWPIFQKLLSLYGRNYSKQVLF